MKKQAVLLFVIGLFCLLASMFFPACKSCNPPKTCNLPAPEVVTGTPTGPTTALLDWDDVAGASGYSIAVIDTTTSTLLGSFDTTASQLLLTGLVSGHFYQATVRANCEDGTPSVNARLGSWKQDIVIIEDEDIMLPPGCTCNDNIFTNTLVSNANSLITDIGFMIPSSSRIVFKFQVSKTTSSKQRHFLLALDYDCAVIKADRDTCDKDEITYTIDLDPSTNSNQLIVKDNGNPIAKIIPVFNSNQILADGHVTVQFEPNNTANPPVYEIKVHQCAGGNADCP